MPVIYLYLPNEKHDIHVKNHLNADVSTNIYHFYFDNTGHRIHEGNMISS